MQRFWTVVKTYEQSSGEAIRSLTAAGFVHYHPKCRQLHVLNGARIRRVLSLFPNYCFVQVTRINWRAALVKGVEHLFLRGDFVSIIDKSFVQMMTRIEDDLGYVDVDAMMNYREFLDDLLPGDVVRGLYGLYAGQTGEFIEMDDRGLARVRFSILGRDVTVPVDAHELVGV
jgi:transcription antitermination factor NusG